MKTYTNESAWMKESLNPNTMLEIKTWSKELECKESNKESLNLH